MPRQPDAPEPPQLSAEVSDLLHQVSRRIRRAAMDDLEPMGVTGAQMRAIRTLAYESAPVRMSVLADSLGIARRSATSVVDELEARGLVVRVHDPVDRRAVTVSLTAAGRKVHTDVFRRRRSAAGKVLGELAVADLERLRDLLKRLA